MVQIRVEVGFAKSYQVSSLVVEQTFMVVLVVVDHLHFFLEHLDLPSWAFMVICFAVEVLGFELVVAPLAVATTMPSAITSMEVAYCSSAEV